jgi:transposase
MEVIDGATGEVRRAEIFVGVLGASSYTFAAATWTQALPDWIALHVAMLAFFGAVPRQIVSDFVPGNIMKSVFSLAARRTGVAGLAPRSEAAPVS